MIEIASFPSCEAKRKGGKQRAKKAIGQNKQ